MEIHSPVIAELYVRLIQNNEACTPIHIQRFLNYLHSIEATSAGFTALSRDYGSITFVCSGPTPRRPA